MNTKQKVLATLAGLQRAVADLYVFIEGQEGDEIRLTPDIELQSKIVFDTVHGGYDLEMWDTESQTTVVHSNDAFIALTGEIIGEWAAHSFDYVEDELKNRNVFRVIEGGQHEES